MKKTIYLKVECDEENISVISQLCDDLNTVLPSDNKIYVETKFNVEQFLIDTRDHLEEKIRKEQEFRALQFTKQLKEKELALREQEKIMRAQVEIVRKNMMDAIGNSLLNAPKVTTKVTTEAKVQERTLKEAIYKAMGVNIGDEEIKVGDPVAYAGGYGGGKTSEVHFKQMKAEEKLRGLEYNGVEVDEYQAIERLFLDPRHKDINKEFLRRLHSNLNKQQPNKPKTKP